MDLMNATKDVKNVYTMTLSKSKTEIYYDPGDRKTRSSPLEGNGR